MEGILYRYGGYVIYLPSVYEICMEVKYII